jgi:crossover junction endodeoxyribonuclease RuvC
MKIIGIDPGITGAIAIADSRLDFKITHVFDTPVRPSRTKKTGNEVDPITLHSIFENLAITADDVIYLEALMVASKPGGKGRGTLAMVTSGDTFGATRAIAELFTENIHRVWPMSWKRKAGLIKEDKNRSIEFALKHHPEAAKFLTRKKDHNRAEAILIAKYGPQIVSPRATYL